MFGPTKYPRRHDDTSSNINEVIRAVLNFFFFYEKILHTPKSIKKHKSTKSTKTQPSKSTKTQISEQK